MITIQRLKPTDWELLKQVRLRALADAPYAFTATWKDAARLTDQEWADRAKLFARTVAVTALVDDIPCGLVSCYFPDGSDKAHLAMMWVAPEARRQGVGKLLVEYVSAWAVQQGFTEIDAVVTEVNKQALHFYSSVGFGIIPERQFVLDLAEVPEIVLRRDL